MTNRRVADIGRLGARWAVLVTTALALGACSFASDTLFGDSSTEAETAAAAPVTLTPPAAPAEPAPEEPGFFSRLFPMFSSDEKPTAPAASTAVAPVASSSMSAAPRPYQGTTVVGQRVNQFRSEYETLRNRIGGRAQQFDTMHALAIANANAYNATVGSIRARLQIGTTPGNPELLAQWQTAQTQLSASDGDLTNLNQLSAQVASDAGTAGYLLDNVRAAYTLSGAVDEDHRQLRIIEDELSQTNISMDRLLQSLNGDISRQQQFVAIERSSLVDLAGAINAGQMYTGGSRGTPMAMAGRASAPQTRSTPVSFTDRRPLVIIRFDKANVQYEPALYQAMSRALERRPESIFDVVAVSPATASPAAARRNADAVMRSMSSMGLPAERLSLATMSSPTATSPEVHVYIR